ncbi:MAG TPA: YetF domain-containing protein [Terriglobia bacterium]|nr:YetF domain-containing protein [Terriglobia bacterium]
MPPIQWNSLFVFTVSPFELFLRGTVIYLLIFVVMRLLRREPGTVGIADLLMVVLIADASQNAMSSEYRSVLDGVVLITTIVFWNYTLDWLTAKSRTVERFTYPDPIPLVLNGRMLEDNMRKQFVTREQLSSMLREHGIDEISKVKAAFLEGSGHLSVIPVTEKEGQQGGPDDRSKRKVV